LVTDSDADSSMGQRRRRAVDRRRRTEHQPAHAGRAHRAQQRDRAGDVVVEVLERPHAGFADGLERGEVDDRIEMRGIAARGIAETIGEESRERVRIADVDAMRLRRATDQAGHAIEHGWRAVGEIVGHHHLMAAFGEHHAGMASDVTGAAADENAHETSGQGGKWASRHQNAECGRQRQSCRRWPKDRAFRVNTADADRGDRAPATRTAMLPHPLRTPPHRPCRPNPGGRETG
jgi:hypothetical protein